MLSIKEILDRLYKVKSPAGFEGDIAKVISAIAKENNLEYRTDAMGNVIVHRKGAGKKCLIDAHMDTIGFLATYIDEKGFVRFDTLGGFDLPDIHHVTVEFLNGTCGVISYEQKTDFKDRKVSSMFIDIGAKSEAEAKELILPGDAAVYAGELRELSNGKISAPYLDNRIGVAVALFVICSLKDCEYDVYAAFTVQEEVGLRGAKTAAYGIDADFAIVVDVTDSCDTPGYDGFGEVKMSDGAAIKIMDKAAIAHPAIVSALCETAEHEKIKYTRDIITIGGTDAGSIHTSRSGVPTGGISVPVRYIHSPCEVADMADIEASVKLLVKTLENHAVII